MALNAENIENEDKLHYLKNLNFQSGGRIWMPRIDNQELRETTEMGRTIVIADDWMYPDGYEYGAWAFDGESIKELQKIEGVKILNEDYIFEYGSSEHRGLIALGVEKNLEFFICQKDHFGDFEARFFFQEGTPEAYIEKAVNAMCYQDEKIVISKDQKITVSPEEYRKMVFEHIPVLV